MARTTAPRSRPPPAAWPTRRSLPAGNCLFPLPCHGESGGAECDNQCMTYVVTEDCIKCKYMDCIEVCPVDCVYDGEYLLVIHPDECIDCGVCAPARRPKA